MKWTTFLKLNWQATFEDANILVGDDIKWAFRPCNQLHINVVSSSDRCYHLQPRRISKQDSSVYCWDPSLQSFNQPGELSQHPFWPFGWSLFCKSKDDGEILNPSHAVT
eukprot:TRINITY_DN2271_c0_g1_i3.p1 TRINITY_DN2271_c0_g1~~TRINITY_DN2271_c0_g1_i3.p1  ORF type:complete len:109 (-),score=17.88 TRINITY_DN2271_c0_g1_i3:388-714(-)